MGTKFGAIFKPGGGGGGGSVDSVTGGENIVVTGTAADPVVNLGEQVNVINTSGGPQGFVMPPSASSQNQNVIVKNDGNAGNDLTITPDGFDQINQYAGGYGASLILTDNESVKLRCIGSNWVII